MHDARSRFAALAALLFTGCTLLAGQTPFRPGTRTIVDAHNCYPYEGKWGDRIDRALAHGIPVAIEQDLYWYTDPQTGVSRSVLAHTPPLHGNEPGMEEYFFDRVRPIVEAALRNPKPKDWPLITLNLDIKTEEPEHLRAIRKELERHRAWLTTAQNVADPTIIQPLHMGPILVFAGISDAQEEVFRKEVPIGSSLLVFGAVHTASVDPAVDPNQLVTEHATNYRRWWNVSWTTVEKGGASKAGEWTESLQYRIQQMVSHAHAKGLWIRFYTLDGATPASQAANGWFRIYNFSTQISASTRWDALFKAKADYIATDQYEDLAAELDRLNKSAISTGAHGKGD